MNRGEEGETAECLGSEVGGSKGLLFQAWISRDTDGICGRGEICTSRALEKVGAEWKNLDPQWRVSRNRCRVGGV